MSMQILKLNGHNCDGIDLPVPSTMNVNMYDIDSSSSGRSDDGKMHRDRVVGGAKAKKKLSVTWKGLNQTEISKLYEAIKDVSFPICCPSPYTGDLDEWEGYAGDRQAPLYRFKDVTDATSVIWETVIIDFVEL